MGSEEAAHELMSWTYIGEKNLLKMDNCMAGQILIRGKNDKIAGDVTWASNWSTEKIYVEEPYHGIRGRRYNE